MFRQEITADQHRHASRDLAHRFEQGQTTVDLDSFVGQCGDAGPQQRFRQGAVRREVQVGEQNLPALQQGVFRGLRLLDLDDQLGPGKHRGMVLEQRGAGLGVFLIRIAGARPGRPLDKHGMPALNQLIRRGGEQGHAVFLLLNFLGKADDHSSRRDGQ